MTIRALLNNRKLSSLLIFGIGLLALLLLWPGGQAPLQVRDSHEYLGWSPRRGVGYPFFLTIFGSGVVLAIAQTVLSIVCWMYLGFQAGKRWGAVLGLIPACTLEIAQYNLLMLSESISIPLFAGLVGVSLHLLRSPKIWLAVLWCLVAMLFAFTRASNLYLVFCLPLVFALRYRVFALVCLVWCMGLVALNKGMHHDVSGRYKAETMNHVYLYRVMPNPEALEHFVALGLPIHHYTMSYVAKEPKLAVYNSHLKFQAHELLDAYPDYQEWMTEHGRKEYLKWLIKRPGTYFEVFNGIRHGLEYYVPHAEEMNLPNVTQALDWRYQLLGKLPIVLWLGCLLIPAWEFFKTRRLPEGEALAILIMVPFAYAHAFLSYHGHPGDVSRYLLPTTAFFRLTILLAVLWVVRRVVAKVVSHT